jgi:predicted RNA-binding Zn ribbon-like protein
VTTPDTLVWLANLAEPRRPGRGPANHPEPPPELAALNAIAVELVDALIAGQPVEAPAAALTELAAPSTARIRLESAGDRTLRAALDWSDPTPAVRLARLVIGELDGLDPARLRRCARAPCRLVFYDTTRSGTRRWHAESPCGLRARQQRHRATAGGH